MVSIHQFVLLFNSIGKVIPVRYLFGCLMCVQFFIGPTLAYNGLDTYQYFMYIMRVPEEQYFGYALPAVILFIIGLHSNSKSLTGEIVDKASIELFVRKNPKLSYFFIVVGFLSSLVAGFFGSELSFVFYLLGSFKFVGLFLLVLGEKKLKVLPLVVVIGSIISSSFGAGMFHDLLTWIVFTVSVFGIRYKFSGRTKLVGAFVFLLLVATIQVMKGGYRKAISFKSEDAGIETFTRVAEEQNKEKGLFSFESLAQSNVRINQGFIITNIMVTVPYSIPYENGNEMLTLIEAGLLPRFLAPDKLRAGDRTIFTKYSNIPLTQGTSMGLSAVGDAYINWGVWGGCLFMFVLGIFYSTILNIFHRYSRDFPILILFTSLVFYYPIRPDCEFQTILGHLFKSCFLITFVLVVWKHQFEIPRYFKKKVMAS